jgi:hypothetical protein
VADEQKLPASFSSEMQLPRKHHFNPAFYLGRFAGADGLVREMRLVRENVILKSRHPDATGFKKDLYRTEGIPEEHSQHRSRPAT